MNKELLKSLALFKKVKEIGEDIEKLNLLVSMHTIVEDFETNEIRKGYYKICSGKKLQEVSQLLENKLEDGTIGGTNILRLEIVGILSLRHLKWFEDITKSKIPIETFDYNYKEDLMNQSTKFYKSLNRNLEYILEHKKDKIN